MEWNPKEAKVMKLAESYDPNDNVKRFFSALLKYSAFATVMILVLNIIFGDWLAADRLAFVFTIIALMVYDLKGREILLFQIIRKLQARVKELEKK